MRAGMSPRVYRLLRDPYAWSAKMTTLTLMVGVLFLMTTKPHGLISAATIFAAVVLGVLSAVRFWRPPHPPDPTQAQTLGPSQPSSRVGRDSGPRPS